MEYKSLDYKSIKIHTIKTDRYKTSKIEVVFRKKIEENDNISAYTFLASMLNESSLKYPSRKALAIKLEEIYKSFYYCFLTKIGNVLKITFSIDFINPEYIDDANYLKKVIEFLFTMILKPNVKNEEFNLNSFNIVKNDLFLDIDSIEENAEKKAINAAFEAMDNTSISTKKVLGTKEDLEKITPENLYQKYLELINDFAVDIFVIGNINMSAVINLIKDSYKKRKIVPSKFSYYVENKEVKKTKFIKDTSSFGQTQLVTLFNINSLTKEEKEVTFHLCNFILGSGGLNSKLYKSIREEKNYCYKISSMYFKYDNLLCIASSLAKKNVDETIKLIKKAIKEMQTGNFTDIDLKDAKQNMLLSLKMGKNNPATILSNFEFKLFLGNYDIDEKIAALEKITKEDIMKVAKKIKENTYYVLNEGKNERN